MQAKNNEGDKTSGKAYSLEKFLNDCKNHKDNILVDMSAIEDAGNSPLHLYSVLYFENYKRLVYKIISF